MGKDGQKIIILQISLHISVLVSLRRNLNMFTATSFDTLYGLIGIEWSIRCLALRILQIEQCTAFFMDVQLIEHLLRRLLKHFMLR